MQEGRQHVTCPKGLAPVKKEIAMITELGKVTEETGKVPFGEEPITGRTEL
jgi:hypothetical protein